VQDPHAYYDFTQLHILQEKGQEVARPPVRAELRLWACTPTASALLHTSTSTIGDKPSSIASC